MKCNICNSNKTKKLDNFKPYFDKEWIFEVYDCLSCESRFALRDNNTCYHEEIHSSENSSYQSHYTVAEKIKILMNTDIQKCETVLSSKSLALSDLFEYIKNLQKDISILEIGCSTGYVTAFLQKLGYVNSKGIDISETAIGYAQLMFGDYYGLEVEENKYDIIFHTGLIGCVDKPKEFLDFYLDYLKEGGVMFFNAPNVESVIETNELWVSTPPPDLIYLFKDKSLVDFVDNRYSIQVKKTLTPVNIIIKYFNQYKSRKNNIYPRSFSVSNKNIDSKKINCYFKRSIFFLVKLLVQLKILKHYSDEYGLIVSIVKN